MFQTVFDEFFGRFFYVWKLRVLYDGQVEVHYLLSVIGQVRHYKLLLFVEQLFIVHNILGEGLDTLGMIWWWPTSECR